MQYSQLIQTQAYQLVESREIQKHYSITLEYQKMSPWRLLPCHLGLSFPLSRRPLPYLPLSGLLFLVSLVYTLYCCPLFSQGLSSSSFLRKERVWRTFETWEPADVAILPSSFSDLSRAWLECWVRTHFPQHVEGCYRLLSANTAFLVVPEPSMSYFFLPANSWALLFEISCSLWVDRAHLLYWIFSGFSFGRSGSVFQFWDCQVFILTVPFSLSVTLMI